MPLSDETIKVRIKRMPNGEPPLKPHQRWALLATGGLVLGLVLYCASLLGARPDNPQGPNVALTPAPPNVSRPAVVPTAADGTPLIDLVCGVPVDDTAPYRTEFYGKTFYFAHSECLERFRSKPEAYVKVKVNVNVKMNPDDPAAPAPELEPVPEATAGEVPADEESVPADDTVTEQPAPAETPEATAPPADPAPAAVEPAVPQPNPDGSVWKDASGNPVPQDNSEPGWLPPDPASQPVQSVPEDNGTPGWVPGAEPSIESQPVGP